MKLFIVDDARLARQELRTLLTTAPDCDVVGEAATVATAQEAIERLRPDLLLLDIQLAGATGFDLLDRLDELPIVIFTTAYDHHAVDAFERNALDYLLKPIVPERLAMALTRARERLATRATALGAAVSDPSAQRRKGGDDTVFIRDGDRCWFVRLSDVSGFEVYGNYARAWIEAPDKPAAASCPLLSRSLGYLEERLDPTLFFRASRSHLINLRWVSGVEPWLNDGYRVQLRDGREVEISRRQAKILREKLEL